MPASKQAELKTQQRLITFADKTKNPALVARRSTSVDFQMRVVRSASGGVRYTRTRRIVRFNCAFCGGEVRAHVWSLDGTGKRCENCGALHKAHRRKDLVNSIQWKYKVRNDEQN